MTTNKTIDEVFDKLNGSSSHACYCQRSTDGGCKCALKDEYLLEATKDIEALITEAKIDELKKLPLDVHATHGSHRNMCIPTQARNSRLAQLKLIGGSDE
ncbi:hypothetical protein H0W80_02755 [Candidatus Saccharibacteria bacterium]|nr:hypothetical protein [Candidatus Saccharibacteria bacterium]